VIYSAIIGNKSGQVILLGLIFSYISTEFDFHSSYSGEGTSMAVKKKAAKKAAAKKPAAKKAVKVAAAPKKLGPVKAPMNKTQLYTSISEQTGVAKKDVSAVIDTLGAVIDGHIKKGAPGTFTMPGLFKVKTVRKPATKARKGINPFTGEETMFKARPARTAVKILPLKKMKDMAS
jgi:nucleoid DNA-binding protein